MSAPEFTTKGPADQDAEEPSESLNICPLNLALLFAATQCAIDYDWADPAIVGTQTIHNETPDGQPLLVLIPAESFSESTARHILALVNDGRPALLITDQVLDQRQSEWLPQQHVYVAARPSALHGDTPKAPDSPAQNPLQRRLYELGERAERDGDLMSSRSTYLDAARSGSTPAMVRLGELAEDEDDTTTARAWYLKAADRADLEAYEHLRDLAEDEDDDDAATYWLTKQAEAGDTDAMFWLARQEEDEGEQTLWYERLTRYGDARGYDYFGYKAKTDNQPEVATIHFLNGALLGSTAAMLELGYVAEDHGQRRIAHAWYEQVLLQRTETLDISKLWMRDLLYQFPGLRHDGVYEGIQYDDYCVGYAGEAMYHLGFLNFEEGRREAAVTWWYRSASVGNNEAAFQLGLLAQQQQREAVAREWYYKAGRLGHPNAVINLALLELNAGNTDQARSALELMFQRGEIKALIVQALIEKADGNADISEALLLRAAVQNDGDAHQLLADLAWENGDQEGFAFYSAQAQIHGDSSTSLMGCPAAAREHGSPPPQAKPSASVTPAQGQTPSMERAELLLANALAEARLGCVSETLLVQPPGTSGGSWVCVSGGIDDYATAFASLTVGEGGRSLSEVEEQVLQSLGLVIDRNLDQATLTVQVDAEHPGTAFRKVASVAIQASTAVYRRHWGEIWMDDGDWHAEPV